MWTPAPLGASFWGENNKHFTCIVDHIASRKNQRLVADEQVDFEK